jgi:hypothetical protein
MSEEAPNRYEFTESARMKQDIHSQYADTTVRNEPGGSSWWPLDCLRSLGRAASIAAGGPFPSPKSHPEYRGFRILTTGQDGAYCARITHHGGQPIQMAREIRHEIDTARFESREEAAQHARFLIASGALNHLVRGANAAGQIAPQ